MESLTKIKTGKVRMSYVSVFEPKPTADGRKNKYSVSLIIPKEDKKTVDAIQSAIKGAYETGVGAGMFTKTPLSSLKSPLHDGDEERVGDLAYKNSYYLNALSDKKPGIVDIHLQEITDKEAFYSGCYGRASLQFYPFNTNGNKGIAVAVYNLQKICDGPRLDGVKSAKDDFNDGFEETVAGDPFDW